MKTLIILLSFFCFGSFSSQIILDQKIKDLKKTIEDMEKISQESDEKKRLLLRSQIFSCKQMLNYLKGNESPIKK